MAKLGQQPPGNPRRRTCREVGAAVGGPGPGPAPGPPPCAGQATCCGVGAATCCAAAPRTCCAAGCCPAPCHQHPATGPAGHAALPLQGPRRRAAQACLLASVSGCVSGCAWCCGRASGRGGCGPQRPVLRRCRESGDASRGSESACEQGRRGQRETMQAWSGLLAWKRRCWRGNKPVNRSVLRCAAKAVAHAGQRQATPRPGAHPTCSAQPAPLACASPRPPRQAARQAAPPPPRPLRPLLQRQ